MMVNVLCLMGSGWLLVDGLKARGWWWWKWWWSWCLVSEASKGAYNFLASIEKATQFVNLLGSHPEGNHVLRVLTHQPVPITQHLLFGAS